jgi:ferredoxin-NADP reductase
MTQDTLQVTEAAPAAQGIQSFELRHPQGLPLQPFSAGSHLRVKTPSGMLRQYSLCNDPAETDRYRIAVKREDSGRGGSASMVDQLQPGDLLEVGLPENQFALDDRASRFLLIAGGIGITPMLSMAYQLNSEGRPYQLIYLSRDAQSTAFLEELRGPEFAGKVKVHHDQGDPARALDLWPLLEKPGSTTGLHTAAAVGARATAAWPTTTTLGTPSIRTSLTGGAPGALDHTHTQVRGHAMPYRTNQSLGSKSNSSAFAGRCCTILTIATAGKAWAR